MLVKGLVKTSLPQEGSSLPYYQFKNGFPADDASAYNLCNSCALSFQPDVHKLKTQRASGLEVSPVDVFPPDLSIYEKPGTTVECVEFGDTKLVFRFLIEYPEV